MMLIRFISLMSSFDDRGVGLSTRKWPRPDGILKKMMAGKNQKDAQILIREHPFDFFRARAKRHFFQDSIRS